MNGKEIVARNREITKNLAAISDSVRRQAETLNEDPHTINTQEPESLDHSDTSKSSTIIPMPQETDSRKRLAETLGDTYSRDRESDLQEGAGRTFPPREVPGFGTIAMNKIARAAQEARSKAINLTGSITAQIEEARIEDNKTPVTLLETPEENILRLTPSNIEKPPTPPYVIQKQTPTIDLTQSIATMNERVFDAFPKSAPLVEKITTRGVDGKEIDITNIAQKNTLIQDKLPNTPPELITPTIESVSEISEPIVENVSVMKKEDEILSAPSKLGIDWAKVQRDFDAETELIRGNAPAAPVIPATPSVSTPPSINQSLTLETNNEAPARDFTQEKNNLERQAQSIKERIQELRDAIEKSNASLAALEKEQADQLQKIRNLIDEEKAALVTPTQNQVNTPIPPAQQATPPSPINTTPNVPPIIPNADSNNGRPTPENISPFEHEVKSQKTLADLCDLLSSLKYKNQTFGIGGRVVKGSEIANRITENILKAKVGGQLDPYFFIPDRIIADTAHRLLTNSTEWKQGVSQYGTVIFEKTKNTNLAPDAQRSVDVVIATITETAKPGTWERIKNWAKTNREGKKTLGAQAFWLSLITAVGIYGNSNKIQEREVGVPTPTTATAAFDSSSATTSKSPTESIWGVASVASTASTPTLEASTKTPERPNPVESVTPRQSTETNSSNLDGVDFVPPTTQNDTSKPDFVVPYGAPQGSAASIYKVDFSAPISQNFDTPDFVPQTTTPTNESLHVSVERPENFPTLVSLESYLSKTKELPAFRQVLSYARGQEEKPAGGVNTRAFWWETMLMQPADEMIPNKASSLRRNLTYAYRSYHTNESAGLRDTIVELPNLDDNQFTASGQKFKAFDTWYKLNINPIISSLTYEQKKILENKDLTLAEYLTKVVVFANEKNIHISGLSNLSQSELAEAQNFQPEKVVVDVTPDTPPTYTPEANTFKPAPSEETRWLEHALENTKLRENMSLTEKQEWVVRGPLQQMINAYEVDRDRGNKNYTLEELQYIHDSFLTLNERLTILEEDEGSVFGSGDDHERINNIIKVLEGRIGAFEK